MIQFLLQVKQSLYDFGITLEGVLTVTLACLTLWYVRLTRKMLNLNAQSFRALNNPFVTIVNPVLVVVGGDTLFQFYCENHGNIPAREFQVTLRFDTQGIDIETRVAGHVLNFPLVIPPHGSLSFEQNVKTLGNQNPFNQPVAFVRADVLYKGFENRTEAYVFLFKKDVGSSNFQLIECEDKGLGSRS